MASGSDLNTVTLPQGVNGGISVGNNVGTRRALADRCDYLLFINNDTYFGPSLVDDLVAASEAHQQAPVAPLILATDPPETVWWAGGEVQTARAFRVIHYGLGQAVPGVVRCRSDRLRLDVLSAGAGRGRRAKSG